MRTFFSSMLAAALILGAWHTTSAQGATVTCSSKPGERRHCPADTSAGVLLSKSSGEAPCLLGKTWGYDDTGVWVSDGCSAEFIVGQAPEGGHDDVDEEGSGVRPQCRVPALRG